MFKSLLVCLFAATLFAAACSGPVSDAVAPAPAERATGRTIDLYYYDLNVGRLFVGRSDLIPPADAPSGPLMAAPDRQLPAGVRAYVFACGSCPPGLAGKTIAEVEQAGAYVGYLEMYTERGKAALTGELDVMVDPHEETLVTRPGDSVWVRMQSEAGSRIVEEAMQPCPDGRLPVACRP